MRTEDNTLLVLKVGERDNVQSLRGGTVWFSTIETFIKTDVEQGNPERGDRYEGVFARLLCGDPRIAEMKRELGKDLELIPDDAYYLLRRKSSRSVHAFCCFGVKAYNVPLQPDTITFVDGTMKGEGNLIIPERMRDNFLQGTRDSQVEPWFFCASPRHFFDAIEKKLKEENLRCKVVRVVYDIDIGSPFFIDPIGNDKNAAEYVELRHKRRELAYQQETRILLFDQPVVGKGMPVSVEPISTHSAWAGAFSSVDRIILRGTVGRDSQKLMPL